MNQLNPDRQAFILYLIGNGESTRSAARIVGVSHNTVCSLAKKTIQKQDRRQGRPPLGEKGRTSIIQVRATEAEYAAWREKAKGYKSLSEWIRRMCLEAARKALNEKADN